MSRLLFTPFLMIMCMGFLAAQTPFISTSLGHYDSMEEGLRNPLHVKTLYISKYGSFEHLGCFPNLEELIIQCYAGQESVPFPESILSLSKLRKRHINLTIDSLPPEIDQLQSLEYLNAACPLPLSIGNLPHLDTLIIRNYPDDLSFANGKGPAYLELWKWEPKDLKPFIGLEHLTIQFLNPYGVTTPPLPADLAELKHLNQLTIRGSVHTQKAELLRTMELIGSLPELRKLDFSPALALATWTDLDTLHFPAGHFPKLENLAMQGRMLELGAGAFLQLPTLKRLETNVPLQITKGRRWKGVSESRPFGGLLDQCGQLESLKVSFENVRQPTIQNTCLEEIAQLKHLHTLELDRLNAQGGLPDSLAKVVQLKHLAIEFPGDSPIEPVLDILPQLTKLKTLTLAYVKPPDVELPQEDWGSIRRFYGWSQLDMGKYPGLKKIIVKRMVTIEAGEAGQPQTYTWGRYPFVACSMEELVSLRLASSVFAGFSLLGHAEHSFHLYTRLQPLPPACWSTNETQYEAKFPQLYRGIEVGDKPFKVRVKWHPNGIRAEEICFEKGKKPFMKRTWYKNGIIQSMQGRFLEYPDGYWKAEIEKECAFHFHPNGEIAQEENFFKGKLHGRWVRLNDAGQVLEVREYQDGKIVK